MRFKLSILLILVILCATVVISCAEPLPSGEDISGEVTTTTQLSITTPQILYEIIDYGVDVDTVKRDSWNIELSFVEWTERDIVVNIIDYDNIGYVINDLYFALDYFENGEWVKVSKINPESANRYLMHAPPNPKGDRKILESHSLLQFVPDVEFKSGHYRITKVLSGREFSTEFDVTFD